MNEKEKQRVDKKSKAEIKQLIKDLSDGEILDISFGIAVPKDDTDEDHKDEK